MREVKIGDQSYEVQYGQNAICALEDELDASIIEILARIENGKPRFADLRAVVWAGMLAKRRNITPSMVGNLMDQNGNWMLEVATPCIEELSKSFSKYIKYEEEETEETEKNA